MLPGVRGNVSIFPRKKTPETPAPDSGAGSEKGAKHLDTYLHLHLSTPLPLVHRQPQQPSTIWASTQPVRLIMTTFVNFVVTLVLISVHRKLREYWQRKLLLTFHFPNQEPANNSTLTPGTPIQAPDFRTRGSLILEIKNRGSKTQGTLITGFRIHDLKIQDSLNSIRPVPAGTRMITPSSIGIEIIDLIGTILSIRTTSILNLQYVLTSMNDLPTNDLSQARIQTTSNHRSQLHRRLHSLHSGCQHNHRM